VNKIVLKKIKRKYSKIVKWFYEGKKEISVAYIMINEQNLEIKLFRDKIG
jgi:hypothetical protein